MKNLVEERKYERLRKLAQELHIPMPVAFWELEVFDKDGRLIQRHRQRSHSWTRNAYNHLASELMAKDADDDTFGAGKLNIKREDTTVVYGDRPIAITNSSTVDSGTQGYMGTAGLDTIGIQVGTGTDAESFEDYTLQTKIDNGTDPTELVYVESETPTIGYADTTLTATHIRYFNNDSGGEITVNEVSIICNGYVGGSQRTWVQVRDKLSSGVAVPDTGQCKVTYTIQLAYPA